MVSLEAEGESALSRVLSRGYDVTLVSRPVLMLVLLTLAAVFAVASAGAPKAAASGGLRYQRGYSVQGSWYCYGWSNGAYHCTQHWTRSGSRITSLNTAWVPNYGASSTSSSSTSRAPVSSGSNSAIHYCSGSVDFSNASQWAKPHGCYGGIYYPRSSLGLPSWGWCNWAAEASHTNYRGYSVLQLAKHYGAPRVNAVVWFNGGVQGASSEGHWANLVAIGPNGWGLVEEMNFYYRGGGFGKIDYRFIRIYGAGVAYLYA